MMVVHCVKPLQVKMLVDPFETKKLKQIPKLYVDVFRQLAKQKPKPNAGDEQDIAGLQLVVLSGMILSNYPIRMYSLQMVTGTYSQTFWRTSISFMSLDFATKFAIDRFVTAAKISSFGNLYLGFEWYRYTILRFIGNSPFHYQMIPPPWASLYLLDNLIQNYVSTKIKTYLTNQIRKPKASVIKSFYPTCFVDLLAMSIGTLATFPAEILMSVFIIDSNAGIPMMDTVRKFGRTFWMRVMKAFLYEAGYRALAGLLTMEAAWFFIQRHS
jgi:hypothetical protein